MKDRKEFKLFDGSDVDDYEEDQIFEVVNPVDKFLKSGEQVKVWEGGIGTVDGDTWVESLSPSYKDGVWVTSLSNLKPYNPEQEEVLGSARILQNQVKCHNCGDTPYSAHRHEYSTCKCGNISVDGGMDYLKRVGGERGYTELSIVLEESVVDECLEAINWANETGRNGLGMLCAVLRVLKSNGELK